MRIALNALVGRVAEQELSAFEVEEIWVQPGTERVNVSTDGEVCVMDTPLHYIIRPRALRVVVPAQKDGSIRETLDRWYQARL
jgi:diacylglycerol kinase family enzyme